MDDSEIPLLGQLRAARRAAALLLIAAAALWGCAATRFAETQPVPDARADHDSETVARVRSLGRNGDWLVIRGYHLSDNFVATLTNSPFSHAAVLDLDENRVIEAESKGIHVTPLADFVAKSHRLLLIRPIWSDVNSADVALKKARGLVGRAYDFLGLIGMDVPDRYYCSELTVEIYRPFIRTQDIVPRPVEPGKLHYWGRVLYDSGTL
jgi:hypothetical protein